MLTSTSEGHLDIKVKQVEAFLQTKKRKQDESVMTSNNQIRLCIVCVLCIHVFVAFAFSFS